MACRTGCPTQDHRSWGECARSSGLRVAWAASARGLDLTAERRHERELAEYGAARKQGIQPRSTKTADIRQAVEVSNMTGRAFDAGGSVA